jgi:hypothetical protein
VKYANRAAPEQEDSDESDRDRPELFAHHEDESNDESGEPEEATDEMFGNGRAGERHRHAPLWTTGAGANPSGMEGEQPPVQLIVFPSHPHAANSTTALHGNGLGRRRQAPRAEQP